MDCEGEHFIRQQFIIEAERGAVGTYLHLSVGPGVGVGDGGGGGGGPGGGGGGGGGGDGGVGGGTGPGGALLHVPLVLQDPSSRQLGQCSGPREQQLQVPLPSVLQPVPVHVGQQMGVVAG